MTSLYKAVKIAFIICLLVRLFIVPPKISPPALPPSLGSLPGADVPAEHVQVPGRRGHVGGDYSARGQAGTAGRGAGHHPRHHLLCLQ